MTASLAIWTSERHVMMLTTEDAEEIKTLILRWLSRGARRIVVGYGGKVYLIVPTNDQGTQYWRTELAPDHELTLWAFPMNVTKNQRTNNPV